MIVFDTFDIGHHLKINESIKILSVFTKLTLNLLRSFTNQRRSRPVSTVLIAVSLAIFVAIKATKYLFLWYIQAPASFSTRCFVNYRITFRTNSTSFRPKDILCFIILYLSFYNILQNINIDLLFLFELILIFLV